MFDKEFLEYLYSSLIGIASCDGAIHEDELSVLNDFTAEYPQIGNEADTAEVKLLQFNEAKSSILKLANLCVDDRHKYCVLSWLSMMTDADRYMHELERELLNLLRDSLGITPLVSKNISWENEQKEVINKNQSSRIVVNAPPGAGKTAIISARINSLIQRDIIPSNIWLISFTKIAVREMKDRVSIWSSTFPAGLKVATLDQTAFRMNISLGADIEAFGGDYEESIVAFTAKIKDRDPDYIDFIEGLEHLIIDEAQDLVGNREELCLALIESLPKECGVTVMGDVHQAIYGWSASEPGNLQLTLQSSEDHIFEKVELKKIHRTSSTSLLTLIEDLRLDLTIFDTASDDDLDRRRELISERLDEVEVGEVADIAADNSLILFRKNTEVLDALIKFTLKDKHFRIRGGEYSKYYLSWIYFIFKFSAEQDLQYLERDDVDLFKSMLLERESSRIDVELIWNYLYEFAGVENKISIEKLKNTLGTATIKPVEFISREYGCSGPVFGTIHSSKGTESDHVFLSPTRMKRSNPSEESRVLFVGATRAKKEAYVISGSKGNDIEEPWKRLRKRYSKKHNTITAQKFPRLFMEIGFEGDYDYYSIVSRDAGEKHTKKAQRFLEGYWPSLSRGECFAKYSYQKCEYSIYFQSNNDELDENLIFLGMFNPQVENAFSSACNQHFNFRGHPPARLSLEIVDVATFVPDPNDQRLTNCASHASAQGSWLIPIIFSIGPFIYPGK